MRLVHCCAALALALLGCNTHAYRMPVSDAGPRSDAGLPSDAAPISDGGATDDSGLRDAGLRDGGDPRDSGQHDGGPTDGGGPRDAGPRDAGPPMCGSGYEPSGGACVDIDECARGLDACPPGECRNLPGSHRCVIELVFEYTGTVQSFSIPSGVTEATVVALGAQGGCTMGGRGGEATATIPVAASDMLHVYVGGAGACGTAGMLPGGFNGGGDKYTGSGDFWLGASGGGASDVRRGSTALANRVIVAGGGGGAGYDDAGPGGGGGGATGGPGIYDLASGCSDMRCPGGGGGTSSGGIGGFCHDSCIGLAGALGQGGRGTGCAASGGGGGGGYYGGGGGAHCPGGGGSSRADFAGNTAFSTRANVQTGAGRVTIRY